jgi:hypothetical protein
MTATVLAISAAYVVMAVLLLSMGLTSRFAWWLKAGVIVLASVFFIEAFIATKGLLGWPAAAGLPPKFQLLWARVVEPDANLGEAGAVYFWVEELDTNNVPSGVPRSHRLPYSRALADKTSKAREEIMLGNAQEGSAEETAGNGKEGQEDTSEAEARTDQKPEGAVMQKDRIEPGIANIEMSELLRRMQRVEFRSLGGPRLPPKAPYR